MGIYVGWEYFWEFWELFHTLFGVWRHLGIILAFLNFLSYSTDNVTDNDNQNTDNDTIMIFMTKSDNDTDIHLSNR